MSDTIALPAEPRERVGKGAARAVRRAGRVPAVIYGDRKDPMTISQINLNRMANVVQPVLLSAQADRT